ncbi:calcium-binding protein [Burkholderia aenigmatica]|uniref:Calcium-binding protein n=1 Tax=Burkholderia aenigmatica TaxID=2015348 RepID=A0A6J5JS67_9BURK|nr:MULTISPECIES: hypothetical protein [Burkholderia]CAB3974833.1 calcium-binding protein [Burkholderia aenigmatica]VWC76420.1 calcium-binding protein [Burkholderia aenigmatica]
MTAFKYPFKDKAGTDVVDADIYYGALGMATGGYYVFGPSGVHGGIHYEAAMANVLSLDDGIGAMTKGEIVAYRINRDYPTVSGSAKGPVTNESASVAFSTGFVLTRHMLEYPAGNTLTYFCLAMHLRAFNDYERLGSAVKRPGYWRAKVYRVKETAKERQVVAKGTTDQPVIGLSVREKPSVAKSSPALGILPHGARITVLETDKTRQWVRIKRVIEKAIVPASTAQTEVPAIAHSGWVAVSGLQAQGQAPDDFDVVVTPDSPPGVKAGELLGHMGEYHRIQDSGQSRKLMHHEVIAGPELRTFLDKSRAAAVKARLEQKTLLRVAPGTQLHNAMLAPPQAGLLPVNTIVALDGNPHADALYVKVKPTGTMQWIERTSKLPKGARETDLFRHGDGAAYTAADIIRVPRQGTVGKPGATRFRGVMDEAASPASVWIAKDTYASLVGIQAGKLLTEDLAQGWAGFPLTFSATGTKTGSLPHHFSRLALEQGRPDKQNPAEAPKVFALDEAGRAWWQVQLTSGDTTVIGWVGEIGHTGISLHSPHEWVDFVLVDAEPTTAAYGSYFADYRQMEAFQRGQLGLKDADLDAPLREVRAMLDANHDGQLTLAELKAAQRDRDTSRQLSRVILRYPCEWKTDKKAWDAYDSLMPPESKSVWEAEKARIERLMWWDDVVGKINSLPLNPLIFHFHPIGFIENFLHPSPVIKQGQLTFDAEGNDIEGSQYFSRVVHWPGNALSGVTLGRGYDMGSRDERGISSHLISAGLLEEKVNKISKAAGLRGAKARDFVASNKSEIGEISRDQQIKLFNLIYPEYVARAVANYDRWTVGASGKVAWGQLHPLIRDVLVDFVYQGFTMGPKPMEAGMENNIDRLIEYIENTPAISQYEPGRRRAQYLKENR